MSDLKGIEITDLLGLSEPLTKLLETVSCGVGKLYEPTHIKRIAKAKAEEIKIISDAVTDNLNLPVNYQNGFVGIDSMDASDLAQRAQNRFLFQQMKKQQNIESVVSDAYLELEGKNGTSREPVDEDWVSSFFDFVANVSNEQMQKIWGKILAGEVIQPGSFSIRTLDILRKLTQREAQLFSSFAPYVLRCYADSTKSDYDYFLLCDETEEKTLSMKYGYSFFNINLLDDAGLFSSNSMIYIGHDVDCGERIMFEGREKVIEITNKNSHSVKVGHSAYLLTENGKELYNAIISMNSDVPPDQYYEDCTFAIMNSELLMTKEERAKIESSIISQG